MRKREQEKLKWEVDRLYGNLSDALVYLDLMMREIKELMKWVAKARR